MTSATEIGQLRLAAPAVVTAASATVGSLARPVQFETVSTRAGFEALEDEWHDLYRRAGRGIHVFQGFNWLWHWANHFLPADGHSGGPTPSIVVGRRDGRTIVIWPLVIEQRRMLRRLGWMGEPASQYGDVLIDDIPDREAVIRAGWDHIRSAIAPDIVHLRKIRADAEIAPFLAGAGAIGSAHAEAPYLDLTRAPNFEAYAERYGAKARKNRRRLLRRLGERGPVEFAALAEGAEAKRLATLAVTLKKAWLRDRGLISPAISDDRMQAFLADVAEGRGRPTGCIVHVLTSGAEPASIEVGFEAKGRLALHVIVYSLKFEKSGVGVLHLEDTIRRCYERGIGVCDLLAPKADYKMDWADGTVGVADYTIALTPRGRIYARLYLGFLRDRMKRAIEGLPVRLRRAVASGQAMLATIAGG